MAIKLKLTGT